MTPTPEMIESACIAYNDCDSMSMTACMSAAIQAALDAMWSDDMDAAPRDGTHILVLAEREGWRGNPRRVCVFWEPSGSGRWAIYGAGPSGRGEQCLDTVIPLKWAHLPQPKGPDT
jgi:hypothetical protein